MAAESRLARVQTDLFSAQVRTYTCVHVWCECFSLCVLCYYDGLVLGTMHSIDCVVLPRPFLWYSSKPRNSIPPWAQNDLRGQMITVSGKEVYFLRFTSIP